jgi:penicillin-binding protein 1B
LFPFSRKKTGRKKSATKKRRAAPRRRKSSSRRKKTAVKRRWLAGVALLGVVGLSVYIAYLDITVRSQFEGTRWALPARVYARPLELYPELQMSAAQFAAELELLGYRAVSQPRDPGSYTRLGGAFIVHTRAFQFWDGEEPSRAVRVEFSGNRLLGLWRAHDGNAVDLLRLDPPQIGSIYPAHNEDRVLVKLSQVPPLLIDALLAVEDRGFYEHHGVSPRAIVRAMLANLRAGHTVQGGSTLTQQLAKNFFLSSERTLWRKFNEAIMALLLDWHYDKDEILEAYINEIYLGQDGRRAIHGFGLASQFYYERPLSKLTPPQIALLVALVKGPSYYDPRRHPHRARERRDLVLQLLAEQGSLSPVIAERGRDTALGVLPRATSGVTRVPAFIDLVRRQLRRDYSEADLSTEGLRIFTTLDPGTQQQTEQAMTTQLEQLARGGVDSALQGAAVVVNVDDGEVLAVVGGRDPQFAGFNRALDAVRPIGSLIKPAVYLTALMRPEQYTLATLLDDGPLSLDLGGGEYWEPQNYDQENHGEVLLHDALAQSYNLSTARLGLELGVPDIIDTLYALGARREMRDYPALLLGAVNFAPIEVAQIYHTLAARGFRTPLRSIRAVLTAQGEPLQRYPLSVEPAFDGDTVLLLNTALRATTHEGTGKNVYQTLPQSLEVAGKTGTTDDLRDSWFAGYSDNRLAVVWLGMDDNQPAGLTGASGALRVWSEVMRRIDNRSLETLPPPQFDTVWIDRRSGLRVPEGCSHGLPLPFIRGTAPADSIGCAWGETITR